VRVGGFFRIIVPDLKAGFRAYLALLETKPTVAAETECRP
jgi:hypothetical protein